MRNLTASGDVYWSGEYWEQLWLEDVPYCARQSIVLFGLKGPPFYVDTSPTLPEAVDLRTWSCAFGDHPWWWTVPMFNPPGIKQTTPALNSLFGESHGRAETVDGESWWINGLVQLQGRVNTNEQMVFQEPVRQAFVWEKAKLPINRKFARAAWLQGTVWTTRIGETVGWLIWRYADGKVERVPVLYGNTTARFWADREQLSGEASFPSPAWGHFESGEAVGRDRWLRIYKQSWKNPHPGIEVASLDFVSNRESPAAPFIVAINVYP